MNGNMKPFIIAILFVVLVSLACESATPIPNTRAPIDLSQGGWTVMPSYTPRYTPRPTYTPLPTATSTPNFPNLISISEVKAKYDQLTKIQWEEYRSQIQGRNIYFSGVVGNVYEDYSVWIDTDKGYVVKLYNVPPDIAKSLNKNQRVEGYGKIRDADLGFLVLYIDIDIYPDLLTVH